MGKCEKCGFSIEVKDYTDTIRIEEHHLHPRTLSNPKGEGKIITLCRDCHIEELHPLILEIVKKYSIKIKHSNSLHEEWKFVLPKFRNECIEEIKDFTMKWVDERDDNGNTATITA